ncbi:META domain-containing protein [Rhodobacterales bacterium LSUCC0387]|nr:META domain-containing protein [Rhodobacterales bacterium LSUCC0387]
MDVEFNFYCQGLCSRYFGRFEVVETGLSSDPIGATLMACPNLDQKSPISAPLRRPAARRWRMGSWFSEVLRAQPSFSALNLDG